MTTIVTQMLSQDELKRRRRHLPPGQIAQDGDVINVPLMLMDSVQRAVLADRIVPQPVLHRPGQMVMGDADVQRRVELDEQQRASLADAWQTPAPIASEQTTHAAPGSIKDKAVEAAHASYAQRMANAWRGEA